MAEVMRRGRVVYVAVALGVLALSSCVSPGTQTRSPSQPPLGGSSGTPTNAVQPNLRTEVAVPAGGSIDVPVAFEGTTNPSIDVSSTSPGITANFGGVALDDYTQVSGTSLLGKTFASPADGSLHVSNPGASPATVNVVTLIYTNRYLTITPSTTNVAQGGNVSFDVTLSEASDSDGATAYLLDTSGLKTPISLTKVGVGHWTGQVAPTVSGASQIYVQTTGERLRYQFSNIAVRTGNVTLGTGFTERLVDTDNDGLANSLELTATVTAQQPGPYSLVAHLVNSTGKEIEVGGGEVSLVAGTQPLTISFDGPGIYQSGLSGPYRLVNVTLTDENNALNVEASATDLGATQAYDYHIFQH
jgi:hypothetical protein